jgi:hypothetical protein
VLTSFNKSKTQLSFQWTSSNLITSPDDLEKVNLVRQSLFCNSYGNRDDLGVKL